MGAPVAFASLITSVQRRANIENQVGFVSLPEIREYLNYGIADLWDLLVKARAQEFYRQTFAISTVANVSAYNLPTDFYELTSVDINLGGNIVLVGRPYMESERNKFRWYPGWQYNSPVYYRLIGSTSNVNVKTLTPQQINFIPAPSGVYSVTLNYYPVFTPFATDGTQDASVFDGINGWEEFAIWRAVADCKAKGDEDPSKALQMVGDLRARIEGLAAMRDAGNAERVHDVYADDDDEPFGFGGT